MPALQSLALISEEADPRTRNRLPPYLPAKLSTLTNSIEQR